MREREQEKEKEKKVNKFYIGHGGAESHGDEKTDERHFKASVKYDRRHNARI